MVGLVLQFDVVLRILVRHPARIAIQFAFRFHDRVHRLSVNALSVSLRAYRDRCFSSELVHQRLRHNQGSPDDGWSLVSHVLITSRGTSIISYIPDFGIKRDKAESSLTGAGFSCTLNEEDRL